MFCVIQKIQKKKPNEYGAHKELKVQVNNWSFGNGKPNIHYTYTYSDERFERPIMDAYKISIHHSYREEGKVKKKQWSICTVDYYDLAESWYGDFIVSRTLRKKLDEMGIDEDTLHEIISVKIDPLVESIQAEFEQTEEYKTRQKHDKITTIYAAQKIQFESEYGSDTYNYCYDVFGELRNTEYLEQLKEDKKANDEYINRSKEESYKRFEEQFNNNNGRSYLTASSSNYSEDEKKVLHEIYRMASKKFHPDVSGDDGSKMKLLTKLKEQWGL